MLNEHVTLHRSRFPADVQTGDTFDVQVRILVRRIEAELVDVSGFDPAGETQALVGETEVESVVLHVDPLHPLEG